MLLGTNHTHEFSALLDAIPAFNGPAETREIGNSSTHLYAANLSVANDVAPVFSKNLTSNFATAALYTPERKAAAPAFSFTNG